MLLPPLLKRLRDDLRTAGYTVAGVEAALGPVASAALHREQALPADRATAGTDDPGLLLARLFVLGRPVPAAALAAAWPTLGVHDAVRLGLICPVGGGMLRAMCDLRPYATGDDDYWVVSDLGELATGGPLRTDHVLGAGAASATLAAWTTRRPVARALDLGTGCGVQTLHLARHVDRIVATDICPRALGYARFTLALNEIDAELRRGDMLDPVAGERFDLVVSNPPFVITPRAPQVPTYSYRDAGRAGDAVVRDLVRSVGDVLAPGGVAQFLGNWEVPAGATWRQVWDDWLAGTELDAWVVARDSQDPAEYAELWARDAGSHPGTPGFQALYGAWLDDFADRDIAEIGFGVVTLQRPAVARPPWRDLVDLPSPVAPGVGAAITAGLAARGWLAEQPPAALWDVRWQVAPDVTQETFGRPGAADPAIIRLRQGGGLGHTVPLDTASAAIVGVCDGELTAGQALGAVAGLLGEETQVCQQRTEPVMRALIADGFLVPATETTTS